MTPIPAPLSLFFLLSLVASFPPDPRIGDCVPTSCGTLTGITYPFSIVGFDMQPDYCGCGNRDFEIQCVDDTPNLFISEAVYEVRSIFYANQSILVALNSLDCPPTYQSLNFTTTPFNVSVANKHLFLINNCTKPPLVPDYYTISCGGYETFSFLSDNYSFPEYSALPAPCQVAVLPVRGFPGANPTDYNKLIYDGFLIDWTLADNCSDCKLSGGDCGFDSTRNSFMCICHDGTHSTSCNGHLLQKVKYRNKTLIWMQTHRTILVSVTVLCSLVLLLTWNRWPELVTELTTLPFGIGRVISLRESEKDFMSPLYPLYSIIQATDNFSNVNKLGEGGFGPVYKGKLIDGQEIAVKRLAAKSGQGRKEFENEIILIAKLQHRNLVRLLGYCIHGEEKILIYEYMPNKSLDYFLYDTTRRSQLDWSRRLHIIEGISQGLLYLHKHSRLKIIHRDLKPSNILLDADMNPKISDFGLARIFGMNETEANTNRIVGTYGYMSPEYAAKGLFSIKSDVFSFGVLLLEIVSGSRNTIYHRDDNTLNLLGYAWELWKEAKWLELVDPSFDENCPKHEISRCIHIALMCVQENAIDRPNMSAVIAMLSSDSAIADPKQPAFFNVRNPAEEELHSVNEATMTTINGR